MREISNYIKEIFNYKELVITFAWKEINVKYKQTVLGLLWAIIRPVLSVLILTYVFSNLGKFPNGNMPYPMIVLSGVLLWQPFSTTIQDGSMSLVSNSNLITKVYFPRLILPLSSIIPPLLEAFITLILILIYFILFAYPIHWTILFIPLIIVVNQFVAFAFIIFLSAINVKYRDFKHLIPFLLQIGMYITPVAYLSNLIPKKLLFLLYLNPLAGEIDLVRYCMVSDRNYFNVYSFFSSLVIVFVLFLFSLKYFIKTEKEFSDFI